jgi:hypothetical protein
MSDFLDNLVARGKGLANVIQPRLPALFEPHRLSGGLFATQILGAGQPEEELPQRADEAEGGLERRANAQGAKISDPPLHDVVSARPIFEVRRTAELQSLEADQPFPVDGRPQKPFMSPLRAEQEPRSEPKVPRTLRLPIQGRGRLSRERERNVIAPAAAPPNRSEKNTGDGVNDVAIGRRQDRSETEPALSDSQALTALATTSSTLLPQVSAAISAPMQQRILQPQAVRGSVISERPGTSPRSSPPQPTIQVTIGRIEVRAVPQQSSIPKARATRPVMSLDEYLQRRTKRGGA